MKFALLAWRVPLAIMTVATAAALASGCSTIQCSETATCSDLDSGASDQTAAPPNDASSVLEATVDVAAMPDVDSHDTEADDAIDAPSVVDACGGPENCTNGIDDNCDGLVDCADPLCAPAYSCVAAPPVGWFGPVSLFDGLASTPAPACSAAFSSSAFGVLNASPSSPSPACTCACGSISSLACSAPTLNVYADNACGALHVCGTAGAPACTTADGPSCSTGGQSIAVASLPAPTKAGSCTSSVTTGAGPGWAWNRAGEACSSNRLPVRGGCDTASVCADKPSSSFQPTLCVWKNGISDCSAAVGYPLLHNYYSAATDTRACSAGSCTCAAPSGVTCSLTAATVYKSSNCTGTGTAITQLGVGQCTPLALSSIVAATTSVTTAGSCLPNGSPGATGGVTPSTSGQTVTVCCSQ